MAFSFFWTYITAVIMKSDGDKKQMGFMESSVLPLLGSQNLSHQNIINNVLVLLTINTHTHTHTHTHTQSPGNIHSL